MYHFANLVPCKDLSEGFEPDLPNYIISFNSFSPKNPEGKWCLCDSIVDPNYEGTFDEIEPVSKNLEKLLNSCAKFPPALAIAMHYAGSFSLVTKQQYQESLIKFITFALDSQPTSKYILCEVISEQVGYCSKGEYVWVIGYNAEKNIVKWVSDDFSIYSDNVSCFKIGANYLKLLGW